MTLVYIGIALAVAGLLLFYVIWDLHINEGRRLLYKRLEGVLAPKPAPLSAEEAAELDRLHATRWD